MVEGWCQTCRGTPADEEDPEGRDGLCYADLGGAHAETDTWSNDWAARARKAERERDAGTDLFCHVICTAVPAFQHPDASYASVCQRAQRLVDERDEARAATSDMTLELAAVRADLARFLNVNRSVTDACSAEPSCWCDTCELRRQRARVAALEAVLAKADALRGHCVAAMDYLDGYDAARARVGQR